MERDDAATVTRRAALKYGMLGAAAMALGGAGTSGAAPATSAASSSAKAARAKSVIQVWMWGGPCHIDTFDPKPDAGYDYCGPLKSAISTNVDGIQIGESLPLLAQQADKYSLIRSMTHGVNAHETATYVVLTGREPGRLVFPAMGAVVSLFKGYDHGYTSPIAPYVVLTTPQGRFSEEGFLGERYKPFATGGDPNQKIFAVEGIVAEGISDERQRSRRALMHRLDTLGNVMTGNPHFTDLDRCEERAYELMFGEARKLFDLTQETDSLREQYGRNTFGQSCLMARRLVEHGVPYITINYNGWDTHKRHFETMRRKLPELDKGLATLLQDLAERGLLDSTIVWCCGEFGRTPRVQWEAPWNGGRGHYGDCYSALVAGGGFQGGRVVGATDAKGGEVADRPVYPQDLMGTMCELLGIDPDGPMPNPRGLDVQVMPASDKAGAGRLTELV